MYSSVSDEKFATRQAMADSIDMPIENVHYTRETMFFLLLLLLFQILQQQNRLPNHVTKENK